MRVIVNGVPRGVGSVLGYHEVCRIAGITGKPTVVVKPKGHDGFSVGPGDTFKVVEGMAVTVAHTGSA